MLAERGRKVVVMEAQGALFFGSTERLLRRMARAHVDARYVIVDFKRVHFADASARKLIMRAAQAMAGGTAELIFADVADDGPIAPVARKLGEEAEGTRVRTFRDRNRNPSGRQVAGGADRPSLVFLRWIIESQFRRECRGKEKRNTPSWTTPIKKLLNYAHSRSG